MLKTSGHDISDQIRYGYTLLSVAVESIWLDSEALKVHVFSLILIPSLRGSERAKRSKKLLFLIILLPLVSAILITVF